MYKVLKDFTDLQDKDKYVYRVGDIFPRSGRVSKKRIEELISYENKRGEPLIEEVDKDV